MAGSSRQLSLPRPAPQSAQELAYAKIEELVLDLQHRVRIYYGRDDLEIRIQITEPLRRPLND